MSVGTSLASLEISDLFSNTVIRSPVVLCYLYTPNSPTFHVSVDGGADDSLHHQVDTALGRVSEGQMVEDYGGNSPPHAAGVDPSGETLHTLSAHPTFVCTPSQLCCWLWDVVTVATSTPQLEWTHWYMRHFSHCMHTTFTDTSCLSIFVCTPSQLCCWLWDVVGVATSTVCTYVCMYVVHDIRIH